MAFSFISLILVAITEGGKRHALVITVRYVLTFLLRKNSQALACFLNPMKAAVSMLKQEYKDDETTVKEALKLAIKVLSKTLDTNKLTSEKVDHYFL